jgi:hypothetical protein
VRKGIEKHGDTKARHQADLKHLDRIGHNYEDEYFFEGLSASEARPLMTGYPNFDPQDVQNLSPTAQEMVKIAEEYNGILMGHVIPVETNRDDVRITVTGFTVRIPRDKAGELKKRLIPASFHETKEGCTFWRE